MLWEQGVVGSNPATPTGKSATYSKMYVADFLMKLNL